VGRASRRMNPVRVEGAAGLGLFALGALPAVFGFVIPALHLLRQAQVRIAFAGLADEIVVETFNTVAVAAAATAVAIVVGLPLVCGRRLHPGSRLHAALLRVSMIGYAVPGTVLAIGLLAVYGGVDAAIRGGVSALGGPPVGLVLSASFGGLVIALTLRFFRLSASKIETGLERLSPSLDQSARTLGRTPFAVMRAIHLPLLTPTMAGAALLLFVDCMKELPATLLLRPIGFETLSTHLYGEAARGTYENGALAACLIVAFGLLPIVVMTRIGRRAVVPEAAVGATP
jgi:iron(III) transport system permease protein